MKYRMRAIGVVALAAASIVASSPNAQEATENKPVVILETSQGIIKIELWKDKAPISVDNFLKYVESGHYDDTIFHRVIPDFMIQGGGFTEKMTQKKTRSPIKNEADNGCKNERGTLAMARTQAVDSATSQFFINLKSNSFLNNGFRDFGYAVFAKVVEGMDIVDAIAGVKTTSRGGHQNVPVTSVVIKKARILKAEEAKPAE